MVKSVTIREVEPVLLRALESSQGYKFDRERAFKEYQGGAEVRRVINDEIEACVNDLHSNYIYPCVRLRWIRFKRDKVMNKEIETCVNGFNFKRDRSVVSVVAGMGDGKSRLLDEMKTIMRGNESFKEQTCYTLHCNFENGATVLPFTTCDMELKDRRQFVEKEMLDRIMFVLMSTITDGPCPVGSSSFSTYQHEHHWGFTLSTLIHFIQIVSPDAFVMICVDGADTMDPLLEPAHFTDEREIESEEKHYPSCENVRKYRTIYRCSCLRIVFKLLAKTLVTFPRVFAVLSSATSMTRRGGDYYAKQLEVMPPSITKMPEEVQNSVALKHKDALLQFFGGHPKAMVFLVNNTSTSLEGIFSSAAAALEMTFKHKELGPSIIKPLLQRILTDDRGFVMCEVIGGTTFDTLFRLGLIRISRMYHKTNCSPCDVDISTALLLLLQRSDNVLCTWKPYYEGADALKNFAASARCIRSHVYEDGISFRQLHSGANLWFLGGNMPVMNVRSHSGAPWWGVLGPDLGFLPFGARLPLVLREGDTSVKNVPLQLAESAERISTRGCDEAAPKPREPHPKTKGNWEVKLNTAPVEGLSVKGAKKTLKTSSETIGDYTILNAHGARAGDFFCRMKAGSGQPFNEVWQCESKGSEVEPPFPQNLDFAVSEGDAFILISQHPVDRPRGPGFGIIRAVLDPTNFKSYFGPLCGTLILPSSSMLASRPVWPATLSLSPTITRTARWVPFLQKICKHI